MKAYVAVTGILFALFASMHFLIAYQHFQGAGGGPASAIGPLAVGVVSGLFGLWALRIYRSPAGPAGTSHGGA
jgi:hypothetical protein